MNTLITNDFFDSSETRQQLKEIIMGFPNGTNEINGLPRAIDAHIKWVGIMEAYKIINVNASSLLDIGCGTTPLSIYFKGIIDNVYAIDCSSSETTISQYEKHGVLFINNDVLIDNTIAGNSLDCIIDSCAIACCMKIPLVVEKISKLLKNGGHFITVCDTNLDTSSGNFINPVAWIELCKKFNLNLVGEYNDVNTNLFIKETNYGQWGVLNVVRLVFIKMV